MTGSECFYVFGEVKIFPIFEFVFSNFEFVNFPMIETLGRAVQRRLALICWSKLILGASRFPSKIHPKGPELPYFPIPREKTDQVSH